MNYHIRMGVPEMQKLWTDLQEKYRNRTIKKREEQLYKKWGKALKLLATDPFYPSLQTHEIEPLSKRYGMKVWQSYLENKKSAEMRMYWVYGPEQKDITIIGLEPHPEDRKRVHMTEFPYLTYRFFNLYYLTGTHLNQNFSKKAGIFYYGKQTNRIHLKNCRKEQYHKSSQ